ncbi:MAG: hypothetical protein U0V48_17215 [Anaerolineales bacterium]
MSHNRDKGSKEQKKKAKCNIKEKRKLKKEKKQKNLFAVSGAPQDLRVFATPRSCVIQALYARSEPIHQAKPERSGLFIPLIPFRRTFATA